MTPKSTLRAHAARSAPQNTPRSVVVVGSGGGLRLCFPDDGLNTRRTTHAPRHIGGGAPAVLGRPCYFIVHVVQLYMN